MVQVRLPRVFRLAGSPAPVFVGCFQSFEFEEAALNLSGRFQGIKQILEIRQALQRVRGLKLF